MKNLRIAKIFYEIADILEMKNVQWKPRAYRRAAKAIEALSEDIEDIYKRGELEEIPGVGERLAKKIEQYIKTGKIKEYSKLKKKVPKGLNELMNIPGMGPKKAEMLYKKLKISTISQLEKAAKKGKISGLPGMGKKSEEDILRGIGLLKASKGRMLLGHALPIAREIIEELKKLKEIKEISLAGSLKRRKETIGDIDILATSSDASKVMEKFCSLESVKTVLAKGHTKSMVILESGIQADLRVIDPGSYGAALQYFIGSKEHNIALRQIAIKKKYKLNEYGLFKGKKAIAGRSEKEVYAKLGLKWIPPELRENKGEIEAAKKNKLPKLVELKDIKGDLHVHSNYSDGMDSIKEIALAAKKYGHSYVCISDHSPSERIANGVSIKELDKKLKEMKKVKIKGLTLLSGAEVDILKDGQLDYPDSVLKKLDFVTAAVHSGFKTPKKEMTERIIKGLDNKYVHVLAHPTGRIIGERAPYNIDLEEVIDFCAEKKKLLEINASPTRLDLNDSSIKMAIEKGVKLAIGTDSHDMNQLHFIELGVFMARRGWAEKADIINTYNIGKLKKFLKI